MPKQRVLSVGFGFATSFTIMACGPTTPQTAQPSASPTAEVRATSTAPPIPVPSAFATTSPTPVPSPTATTSPTPVPSASATASPTPVPSVTYMPVVPPSLAGGHFSAPYNALSDKPEVTMVTPARNGSGVDPKTSFVLKFSEPMDTKTVEETFSIRSFNTRKLSVDTANLRTGADNNTVTGNGKIADTSTGSQIWDKEAFNISWNSDDTEVTFSFKEEKLLPTDKDSNLVPDYQVAFRAFSNNDRVLKDKSGISRSEKHFKLTGGDFEESYKFSIKTDEVKPTITGITAETNENGGQNGDSVSVRYSERMIIHARSRTLAGGMNNISGSDTNAPAAYPLANAVANSRDVAKNYRVSLMTGTTMNFAGSWWALGGTAVYDSADLTHKTVLLQPPTTAGVLTAAAVSGSQVCSLNITYADGTFESAQVNATANLTAAQLEILLDGLSGNSFTVSALSDDGDGVIEADETFQITLNAGASKAGKSIAAAWLVNSGLFAGSVLNKAGENLYFIPGNAAGTKGNLYKPGDSIHVEVSSTVLDPAGNSLDTSRNKASSNAR